MNARSLDQVRFSDIIGLAQQQRAEGNGKARASSSSQHRVPNASHSDQAATQIVREWRRVYQNLYGT
jgi:hypothetical protein